MELFPLGAPVRGTKWILPHWKKESDYLSWTRAFFLHTVPKPISDMDYKVRDNCFGLDGASYKLLIWARMGVNIFDGINVVLGIMHLNLLLDQAG